MAEMRYPTEYEENLLRFFMPTHIATDLGRYLLRQSNITWPDLDVLAPEYSREPLEQSVTAHTVRFVNLHAQNLMPHAQNHDIDLKVLPEQAALDGLESYYEELRRARSLDHKKDILAGRQRTLRTKGRAYGEAYIVKELHANLSGDPVAVYNIRSAGREYLLERGLLDVIGALGTAIRKQRK